MNREDLSRKFYIDDHAALFGYIAKSADENCGEEGLAVVRRGIAAYGRERGLRAAMRCIADGNELTMMNYIVYGEWADPRGWSRSEVASLNPVYRTNMTVCAWCEAWKKYGLIEYGKIYCDNADENLVHGFNPELRLEMGTIMSHGANVCEFIWNGAALKDDDEAAEMSRRRAGLIPRATKDFLYHCGHVLSTFRREILLELGLVEGAQIVRRAMTLYGEQFGRDKAEIIEAESELNFLKP
ncbi:MAG: L-2-amino-thiazoline-4-carboxylic acid hydrolase [Synergistaceae bacterium]|jgi:hypothetical protein|nr:L-2-amino-thiazoline-4-carboxylic acid hydrolase [Synergistaceae bacterium]